MISTANVLDKLIEEDRYNFRLWLEDLVASAKTEDENVRRAINTVELFSFGDYIHYQTYGNHYLELPHRGIKKLVKATLASALNSKEGQDVSFDEIIHDNCLEQALEQLNGTSAQEQLLDILIEMIDIGTIQALIDEVNGSFFVNRVNVARDAYNSKTYSLRVLRESDIIRRSLIEAKDILRQWVATKLDPSIQELSAT